MLKRTEQSMFFCAMRFASEFVDGNIRPNVVGWADHWEPVAVHSSQQVTYFWPRGTKLKRHAVVVRVTSSLCAEQHELLRKHDPVLTTVSGHFTYYYYEDGYDVMAGTGALSSIRCKQESQVLR